MNGVPTAETKCENSDVLLLISFNLLSASAAQHQVALCNCTVCTQFSLCDFIERSRLICLDNRGVGGRRGRSSTRSWQTLSFHPPQHMATVPSQSLINSCHSSHNQYHLISHVCVTLFPHTGSIHNPRDRDASARVEMKTTNYWLEEGQPYIHFPIECYFHNAFAVAAFYLWKNQWEVHTAFTCVFTHVEFDVDMYGQICK